MVLERLKCRTTRESTAFNYLAIWRAFNKFLLKLDRKPTKWEQRVMLYGAYLVERGVQSSTIQSYFSAIKKILIDSGYKFCQEQVMLSILSKSCKLINDRIRTRMPIHRKLLDTLLFELGRKYATQPYLQAMYKCLFSLAYYGLFRIGELTLSDHVVKVKNVYFGVNKNKILIILYTSKTHGLESRPQKVKIAEVDHENDERDTVNQRIFCPFRLFQDYMSLRGNGYKDEKEPFFVFRDRSPVKPENVRNILKDLIKDIDLDCKNYNTGSFRIGRCSDLIKAGFTIDEVKRFGRWKLNAIFKYIRN